MTFYTKKDHVKNSDLQPISELSMNNIENDDDQDIYISERSSIASSNDIAQTPNAMLKRLPTPTPSPTVSFPSKPSYTTFQCHLPEFLENGSPVAHQSSLQHKVEKRKKKALHKRPSGQGNVVSFPETKSSEYTDNHYPHYHQQKNKTSDQTIRRRPSNDSQLLSNEFVDSFQTASIKSRQQQQQPLPPRKTRQNGAPLLQSTSDKQRHDHMGNNTSSTTYVSSHEQHDHYHQHQGPLTKHCITLKNDDDDGCYEQPTKLTKPQQRRKGKLEHEWSDHYAASLRNKSPHDPNSLIITSNTLTNRSKNRSKMPDKNLLTTDYDDDSRHHRQCYQQQNPLQSHHSPSILSSQNHHPHVRRRPPSGSYLPADFQVMDVSFKKPERSPYFHQRRDSFHSPSPPIYHQNSSLPPIIRDQHQHKTKTTRFPTEYYGTLARQPHTKDWEQPVEISKLYKTDSPTRFYDRYLTTVVEKRLAA